MAIAHCKESSCVLASRSKIDALDKFAEEIVESLIEIIEDADAGVEQRGSAARDLVGLRAGDEEIVETVVEQLTPQTPPEVAGSTVGLASAQ